MATTILVSGVQYSGIWNISSQANAKGANTWPAVPGAPTIGTATVVGTNASVAFTAPANLGNPATITGYTVTSSPGGLTGTGTSSPITVTGFTQGQAYTFTVTATNASGTSPASAASNSITPNPDSYLYTWGNGLMGALGLGNTTYYSSPKQVGALITWSKVAGGKYSSVATKTDGTLWTWGRNNNGQLGLGNSGTDYSSPKQVGALTTWLNIASGSYYTIATKTDGTLWTWGYNNAGQLGLNNTTSYSSPKQVGSLTNWSQVACGTIAFTVATKTDGTLWAWGSNNNGSLGLSNTTYYSSPKQIGALTNWLNVSAAYNTVIATKTDGTLWTWGRGSSGQLGLGNTTSYSSPKQVGALTNWLNIAGSGSGYSNMATTTSGTLYSWGDNGYGQLGLGDTTNRSSPTQVGSLTTWSKIALRSNGALATKTDGTLWVWGRNNNGQLGLGNTTYYSSPKQVGSSTTWLSVAAGFFHSITTKS